MEKITINRPVVWKAVVTDQLRKELHQELERAINRLDMEIQQLEFQAKRILPDLERQNLKRAMEMRQQIEEEKQKRHETRERFAGQIQDVSNLTTGEEIARGTLESWAEVSIGDDLRKILYVEIVTKDNQVVELREGRSES
ncbi:MAG: 16S rRNA processing protein RimM [Firmicutes bacterium]|nr:16S rRNA processing protein RimM [Bacillota bacterium]